MPKHIAPQYELPMQVEPRVQRETFTCDSTALGDKLHDLERMNWRVVALNRLPRNIGYTLECERIEHGS